MDNKQSKEIIYYNNHNAGAATINGLINKINESRFKLH